MVHTPEGHRKGRDTPTTNSSKLELQKTGKKCFSKKSIPKKRAVDQLAAIQIHSKESANYFERLIESYLNEI